MAQYAELLALRFDAKRTRHAYYRAMRVLHEHFQCDPATLEESHLRDYLLQAPQALEAKDDPPGSARRWPARNSSLSSCSSARQGPEQYTLKRDRDSRFTDLSFLLFAN